MRPRTLRYLLREGVRGFHHHRALNATAVATMAAGLLLLGVFLVASYNVRRVLSDLEGRKEVVVYLKDGVDAASRGMVEERLALHPAVSEISFVSREEAWEEFSRDLNAEGLLEAVGGNPLPDALRLTLAADRRDADAINGLALEVRAWDEVEDVVTGGEWVASLDRFAAGVLWTTGAMGLLVALSMVAIIANTVRLTVLARSDLIAIMRDVGASEMFIRIPFLGEGILQTLAAAIVAFGVLFGATWFAGDRLPGIAFFSVPWSLAFLGSALLLGFAGSLVSVQNVLRRAKP